MQLDKLLKLLEERNELQRGLESSQLFNSYNYVRHDVITNNYHITQKNVLHETRVWLYKYRDFVLDNTDLFDHDFMSNVNDETTIKSVSLNDTQDAIRVSIANIYEREIIMIPLLWVADVFEYVDKRANKVYNRRKRLIDTSIEHLKERLSDARQRQSENVKILLKYDNYQG